MKLKALIIILIGIGVIYWSINNSNKQKEVEDIKQEMSQSNSNTQTTNAGDQKNITENNIDDTKQDDKEVKNNNIASENFTLEQIGGKEVLEFDIESLKKSIYDGDNDIEIYGKTLTEIESISVEFSNLSSKFKNDSYKLKTFKQGDDEFKYVASPYYEVLDKGENTYIFTAKSREGESITKLTINIATDNSNKEGNKQTNNGTITDIDFPKGDFGEAIFSSTNSVYYSDIKGLEITEENKLSNIVCEIPESEDTDEDKDLESKEEAKNPVTEYIIETYQGWSYWNTCRPIVKDKGIMFFVLRLEGDDYKYEKHYLDYTNNLHGVLELETGTGVNKENIGDKNSEFKENSYPKTEIADKLFKELIK